MAGDWIKMRSDLAEDPAVICIAGKVGLDEFAVVGRLQFLWAWFDAQSRDGHATGVTEAWVNRKVQCDGFAQAMADAGWLIVTSTGIEVPNFDRHNGETAKTRALGSKRKQKERSKEDGHAVVTQSSRDVSRNDRDKSVTREEKRREEKKEKPVAVALPLWLESIKAKGEKAIPETDAVFAYAEEAGIPIEFLHLAWREFRARYSEAGAKKYIDWRAVFRKAVRGNWLKLWWLDGQTYALTTVGMQAQRVNREAA